jgi:hypothetical protein
MKNNIFGGGRLSRLIQKLRSKFWEQCAREDRARHVDQILEKRAGDRGAG